jgi:lipid-A-disaccharide synthase
MRRFVDHVLCKLPFEETWYRQRGCNTTYVGHPYFDALKEQRLDADFLAQHARLRPLVAILPGSRTQEVTNNLRWLLKAADIIRSRVPDVQFAVAGFRPQHAELARTMIATTDLPVEVFVGRTGELIHLSKCCMAVSGSVSLELLYHAKPTVILYWVNRFAYLAQAMFRTVKYITLVNLLAADELPLSNVRRRDRRRIGTDGVLMPEYLTYEDRSADIAGHVIEWLNESARYERRVADLEALQKRLCLGGASRFAAQYILRELRGDSGQVPMGRPHFPSFRAKRPA